MDEMPDLPGGKPLKGRGAVANPTGRYEREVRVRTDDGWARGGAHDSDSAADDTFIAEENRPRTRVLVDATRTAITRNDSPDIPFDRSINPYRGCEHGCIYCYARPTHAWLGLSPGLDFETQLLAKPNAPELLKKELRRKSYTCKPIAMGTNTDPYQPIERKLRITRGILQVLSDYRHPVTIVTKADAVLRDLDILAPMAAEGLAKVFVSVTTLDAGLARRLEPRAATPARRLAAVRVLHEAGVPGGVMCAPVIPILTDPEMEKILEAAHDAGAKEAGYVLLRLPLEVKDLFEGWLRAHAPDKAEHVLSLVRQTRAGVLNNAEWGKRMRGEGPYAQLIARRFRLACQRIGLGKERSAALDCSRFRPPAEQGDQLSLL